MGVLKGTPRPPNAGRKKGTPNKRTPARAVLRRIDAEGIAGAGFGPGDAYRALWEQVGILRQELAAEERKRSSDKSQRDTLRDQLAPSAPAKSPIAPAEPGAPLPALSFFGGFRTTAPVLVASSERSCPTIIASFRPAIRPSIRTM